MTFDAQNASGNLPLAHAYLYILFIHLAMFSGSALVMLLWIPSNPGARFALVFLICSMMSSVVILNLHGPGAPSLRSDL